MSTAPSVAQLQPSSVEDRAPARGPRAGQAVALVAGLGQVLAGFLAWTGDGASGLDVVGPLGARVGTSMLLLAALPLMALLTNDRGWPRVVSGTLTGALVLAHLGGGPDGALAAGVALATWTAIGLWLAGALATGPLDDDRVTRIQLRR